MSSDIFSLKLGLNSCYLIRGKSTSWLIEAFVGCLAHNGLPFRQNPGFPIYAQDINMVKESWRLLIDKGAKIIFPGHGNPFPVDIIRKELFS